MVKEKVKNDIKFFDVPISIQITLYKHNLIDNTLIGNVLRYANLLAKNDSKTNRKIKSKNSFIR
jgi:hypothetical protein